MQPSSFNHLSKRQHYTSDSGYFSYFEGNRQTKRNSMASGDYERLPMYVSVFQAPEVERSYCFNLLDVSFIGY